MAIWHERFAAGAAYLSLSLIANLVWEIAQLPLYTVWTTGSRGEMASMFSTAQWATASSQPSHLLSRS